jgi:ATP-dependent Lhr-like helicase
MSFELFNPNLQEIIKKRFTQPTLAQKLGMPPILQRKNVLLIAPVASGKTEAAILPLLDHLMKEKLDPISILYISPLKSLNRDLLDRLIWWSNQTEIEASVRHGDTSPYRRKLQTEFPPHLLIITLETLQPILTGKKIREHLRNVKWVILDEVHEIVDSKRGIQLALALERLRKLCGSFQLVMLSATVGDPEKVANFFSGEKKVEIVNAVLPKQVEIKVINPKSISKDKRIGQKIFSSQETAARLRTIMELIKNSRSTLTFTNTREFTEILTSRIKTLEKNFPVEVHHSSLSKEVRIKAEKKFKQEELKSLIATSSLQLGIDIGSVDLVLQYMSPRQVTHLIQRVGRSGHTLKRISKGIVISTDVDDIFESSVIARRALAQELEEPRFHKNSLDVLAHQLIGLTFDMGKVPLKEAYKIVRSAWPYRTLSYKEFLEVCNQLEKLWLIFLDGHIKKKRRGFQYYFSQLSTIPDQKQYKIFNALENSFVGTLDEEFVALNGSPGTTFIVKGEAWRIIEVEDNKVLVEPTEDIEAAIPGWEGELIPVPFGVAQEVGRLRSEISKKLGTKPEKEIVSELQNSYPIDENCARKMINLIKKQKKFGIPDNRTVLIEDHEDLVIIHSCFGTQTNETLGRFLTTLLTARLGSVALRTDPYRIMIKFQRKDLNMIKEILFNTNPDYLKDYLEISLGKSELFAWKFVHVAKRFGAIERDAEYGKVRMKRVIEDYAGSPIHKETLKELETEKLDIKKATEILREIQEKKIKVVFKSEKLSPLGKLGVIHKYAEVVGPEKSEKEIFDLFKKRLLETKVRLVCLNCVNWDQTFKVNELPKNLKCSKCGAKLLGMISPRDQEGLKIVKKKIKNLALTNKDEKTFERIRRTADLFLTYGNKSTKCLAGRGVGPETATRILARFHKTEEDLLKDILKAEKAYLKTKQYWKV